MKKAKTGWGIALLIMCLLLLVAMTSCMTGTDLADAEAAVVERAENAVYSTSPTARSEEEPRILVHYMPWYQAPPISNQYGWHWHMGSFEPYYTDENGLPQIASHFMPLTGPYDSSDPAILEYQTLLMMIAGIDGVIIDWYGTKDALDYGDIHSASRELLTAMENAGLQFAVCYEDQTFTHMITGNFLAYADAQDHAAEVLEWVDDHWFSSPSYMMIDGRPVFLCFGPQFFMQGAQWDTIFSGLNTDPFFVTLDDHMENYADASYPWPPMHRSVRGELSLIEAVTYLNEFYVSTENDEHLITSAFPGFKDIYAEAGIGNSYGYLNSYGGETFRITLEAALQSRPDIIQVVTWNDYGEGTIIEPTLQTGYTYLKQLQDARKTYRTDFPFNYDDLEMPIEFYLLRRDQNENAQIRGQLDALYRAVVDQDAAEYQRLKNLLGI